MHSYSFYPISMLRCYRYIIFRIFCNDTGLVVLFPWYYPGLFVHTLRLGWKDCIPLIVLSTSSTLIFDLFKNILFSLWVDYFAYWLIEVIVHYHFADWIGHIILSPLSFRGIRIIQIFFGKCITGIYNPMKWGNTMIS